MSDGILVERDGAIATVTLDRPDRLNALTLPMWRRLGEVLTGLSADDGVRCVVLRGAGGRAFAPGNDISEFETDRSDPVRAKAYGAVMHGTIAAIDGCRHPTVALIEGVCVGGGLEIAALCDIRICGVSSRFGAPVNRLGLVMAHAEMAPLIALAGRAAALEILLEGRVFGAAEARRKGLVNRVVADDRVAEEAYASARRIAAGAPLAARWHKRFARRLEDPTPLTEAERDEAFACFGTEDFRIGYRALSPRRRPNSRAAEMTEAPSGKGPLAGLRVIELAHVMAGPVCGLMLADMGADVVKVEKVPGGDDSRRMVPPEIDGQSAAFMMMNRNKRGVAIDLKHARGKAVLRRLLRGADVVIENYRLGALERLGFGYDSLTADNPGLILCEISGFGRTGPYAGRGGYDLIAQGMSGLMSITGEGPGRPPVKVGAPVTDITAGILGAMGVLAACFERRRTGRGQRVDTSLFEAGIVHTYWQSAISMATGVPPGPMGSAHPLNGPYQAFSTSDGWITVGAANQTNWLRLLDVLEAPALAGDPRFADNAARMAHLAELEAALSGIFATRTGADWLDRLDRAGVPAGPVLDVAEMHRDPQTLARGMVVEVEHERLGPVPTLGLPVKFSETPGAVRRGAPLYGRHTRAVLAEHGFGEAEIEALIAAGTVVAG